MTNVDTTYTITYLDRLEEELLVHVWLINGVLTETLMIFFFTVEGWVLKLVDREKSKIEVKIEYLVWKLSLKIVLELEDMCMFLSWWTKVITSSQLVASLYYLFQIPNLN